MYTVKSNAEFLSDIRSIDDRLKNIRLSSIEITEVNDRIIELMKKENRIARHLHIPVQSDDCLAVHGALHSVQLHVARYAVVPSVRRLSLDFRRRYAVVVLHYFCSE